MRQHRSGPDTHSGTKGLGPGDAVFLSLSPLAPGGAGGTSGEQPSANFPWALEFRCPALTAALPACDTVPRCSHRTGCANLCPSVGRWRGRSCGHVPACATPRAHCLPCLSLTQQAAPLAPGTGYRSYICAISEISAPSLLTGSCRDERGTQGMPPSLGQCLGGRCTGLSSRVCCSSKLTALGVCKDQSCRKAWSHQQSLSEQMLKRKSRWALHNLGYPENKELEILSKDRRCRWRQAAGSILGFGPCWEGRAGLCTCCSKAELPRGLIRTRAIPPWRPSRQHWGVPLLLSAPCILKDLAREQESQCTQAQLGLTRLCVGGNLRPQHHWCPSAPVHACLAVHPPCSQLPTQRANKWSRGSAQGAGPSPF